MRMWAAIVAALFVAAACGPGPSDGTPAATGIDGQVQDGAFRLTIHAERPTYRTDEALGISASLTYLGPEPTVDVGGSSSGLVGFALRQLDGHLEMEAGWHDDCRTYAMERGAAVALPFVKSGWFDPSDPDASMWQAFFAYKELYLPAGTWQIDAVSNANLGKSPASTTSRSCPGEEHVLRASVIVRVEP